MISNCDASLFILLEILSEREREQLESFQEKKAVGGN